MTQITDLYLRADTEADILAAFEAAGIPYRSTAETTVDVIGHVVTQPAEYDESGDLVSEAVVDDRWHVNVYTRDPAVPPALSAVVMDPAPTTPHRKRAGA